MKTSAIIRIVIYSFVAILLTGVLVCGIVFSNFDWSNLSVINFGSSSGFRFDDAEYTVGSASFDANEVNALNIDWISGEVSVAVGDGNTVEFSETYNSNLKEKDKMRYKLNGGKLTIKSRASMIFNFGSMPSKKLTVTLPKKMYDEVRVSVTSAKMSLNDINADRVSSDSVSGELYASNIVCDRFDADTTSGSITADNISVDNFKSDSVSGRVKLNGAIGQVNSNSVSGGAIITSSVVPTDFDFDTVSGEVVLTLPDSEDGFTLNYDSVSGDFDSDFNMQKHDGTYIYKGGKYRYSADSVSGNVTIRKAG